MFPEEMQSLVAKIIFFIFALLILSMNQQMIPAINN